MLPPAADHALWAVGLFWGSAVSWLGSEAAIGRRKRGGVAPGCRARSGTGPRPRVLFTLGAVSALAATYVPGTRAGGPEMVLAGTMLVVAGVVLRQRSVASLGEFFTIWIAVRPGQHVVDAGPYRFVRHPAYLGALLSLTGFGLALTDWASILVCVSCGLAAIIPRILLEEQVLRSHLGEQYERYAAGRPRLLPGLW